VDEPALPAAMEGAVPSPSGLSRVRAVDEEVIRARLRTVLGAVAPRYTVIHCCGWPVPFGIIRGIGADGASFDLSQLRTEDLDALAETAEAGLGLLVGAEGVGAAGAGAAGLGAAGEGAAGDRRPGSPVVSRAPGQGGYSVRPSGGADLARLVADVWRQMGLPPGTCAPQVVITPACGLAGVSPAEADATLRRVRDAARILPEIMEEQRS